MDDLPITILKKTKEKMNLKKMEEQIKDFLLWLKIKNVILLILMTFVYTNIYFSINQTIDY